eukprot:TRINITY_DN978_c0_g1_i3.p1 TRINITY_DN978_c0_g1~~TRINITY_DN978_c0_g1_i3.p1  ORF type:complete len:120 (-),score=11.50 TRINITY_DN978_c0_g1_i3:390-749(-)
MMQRLFKMTERKYLRDSTRKVVCVARNYPLHAQELGNQIPPEPVFFLKPISSAVFEGEPIVIPNEVTDLHYEVELGVIISKKAKNVTQNHMDYIGSFILGIDMTARNLQQEAKNAGMPW